MKEITKIHKEKRFFKCVTIKIAFLTLFKVLGWGLCCINVFIDPNFC